MTPVFVSLTLATICFTYDGVEQCHPALLGNRIKTPSGEFTMIQRYTDDPGYGGDVLEFDENETTVFAIHRVWTLKPEQKRVERLNGNNVKRRFVTGGCINVQPEVYEKLVDCCSNSKLVIK